MRKDKGGQLIIKIACTDRMVPGATLTEKAEKLVQ